MSTVKQIADAEAQRAEADDDETGEGKGGDTAKIDEPIVEPEEQSEPTEQQVARLEREISDHLASVHSIMGAHVDGFGPCDTCGGMGLVPPTPPPVHYEDYKTCDTCNGYGAVLTGARNPENANVQCPRCAGRGFLERAKAPSVPPAPAVAGLEPVEASGDEWGVPSWMGDPKIRPGA